MGDNKWLRNSFVWLIVMIAVLLLFFTILGGSRNDAANTIPISKVLKDAAAKPSPIKSIEITNDSDVVHVKYNDNTDKISRRESATTDFTTQLKNAGYDFTTGTVDLKVNESSQFGGILNVLTFLLPTLLFIGVLVFMMR